jgi:hypothetical protein
MKRADTLDFETSLTKNPYVTIFDVVKELNEASQKVGTKFNVLGVFGDVATDAEWLARAGNDGAGNPVPRPVFELPPDLAANATVAQAAHHARQSERFGDHSEIMERLKAAFLVAIGKENIALMQHVDHGMTPFSVRQIKARMVLKYGTATAEAIEHLYSLLAIPINGEEFEALAGFQRKVHGQLDRAGQPLSEYAKCKHLQEATQSQVEVVEAIKNFKIAHPAIATHIFDDMVAYVAAQAPNMKATVSSAGYHGHAAHNAMGGAVSSILTPPPNFHQMITDAVNLALGAGGAQANGATGGGPHGGGGPAGGGRRAPKPRVVVGGNIPTTHYCYHHGYNRSHNGPMCKVMLNPAAGTSIPLANLNATSHLDARGQPNGGSFRQG